MPRHSDGFGVSADAMEAAELAAAQALEGLGGRTPDLALAFVSGPDASGAGERALALTGARVTLGCTGNGVMGAGQAVLGATAVSVWAAVLPGASLRTFHLEVLPVDGAAAVVGLPTPSDDDEALLLLADPYSFPIEGFMQQVDGLLGAMPVVGGLAHAVAGPGSARLWVDGRTVGRGAVGLQVAGAGARVELAQGCRAVGPVMTVTASEGDVLLELAGRPAADKVRQVLADLTPPDQALATVGLHLGIAMSEYGDDPSYLVRPVVGTDPASGGLVLADRVAVGQTVRLQVRDADAADLDLKQTLAGLRWPTGGGALLFTCRSRGDGLFGPSYRGADHDAALVREVLQADAVAGVFADGELGPVGTRSYLHGYSTAMLLFP